MKILLIIFSISLFANDYFYEIKNDDNLSTILYSSFINLELNEEVLSHKKINQLKNEHLIYPKKILKLDINNPFLCNIIIENNILKIKNKIKNREEKDLIIKNCNKIMYSISFGYIFQDSNFRNDFYLGNLVSYQGYVIDLNFYNKNYIFNIEGSHLMNHSFKNYLNKDHQYNFATSILKKDFVNYGIEIREFNLINNDKKIKIQKEREFNLVVNKTIKKYLLITPQVKLGKDLKGGNSFSGSLELEKKLNHMGLFINTEYIKRDSSIELQEDRRFSFGLKAYSW